MFPTLGTPIEAGPLEVGSRCLFHLDMARLERTASGQLLALSQHLGAFSRGTTLAGVLDAAGSTYTAVDAQLALEMRDDGAGGKRIGLRMGASDRLAFASPPRPQALKLLLDITETGARGTADATLFAICNDAVSGARFWLDSSGTYYRMNYSDGTTTRTATLVSGQPTSGQRVRFIVSLSPLGALTISQSIDGAAPTTASAAALALSSAWGVGAVLRLNSRGDTENPAQACYHALKLTAYGVSDDLLTRIR